MAESQAKPCALRDVVENLSHQQQNQPPLISCNDEKQRNEHEHNKRHKKRKDLQGIRGVAISFVLLMHLSNLTFFDLVLLASTYGYSYLIYPFRKSLATDTFWAITFTSNMQAFFQETGYWIQLSNYNFLAHMWSLAVEWQYYLLVPVIIGLTSKCCHAIRIVLLAILCTLSISFQLLALPEISFGFLPSRIWQFTFGSLAYESTKIESLRDFLETCRFIGKKHRALMDCFITNLFLVLLSILVLWSSLFLENFTRGFATFSVAVIIFIESDSILLTNKFITYFGDISYVLYLIHWPIIVATRYHTDQEDLDLTIIAIVVVLCLAISVAVHHSIEIFFIQGRALSALMCVIGCYIFICGASSRYINGPVVDYDILSLNLTSGKRRFQMPCNEDRDTQYYTGYAEEPELRCVDVGNGSATILLIGNSIAFRAYPLIHDILRGRYKTLRLMAKSSCPALSNWCPQFSEAVRKVVEHEKPDILMNIHHSLHPPFVAPIIDLKTDLIYNQFQSNINFFSNFSKHIVIDMPYYRFSNTVTGRVLAKRIALGLPMGDDLVVTWEQYINQARYHRKRISSIVCNKCILNDVNKALFQNGLFYTYDPETLLARLSDGNHLTPVGLEMLRTRYAKILENLLHEYTR